MKKQIKSMAAIMLSLIMTLMLGLNAFVASAAKDTQHTIKITLPTNDTSTTHDYKAYQIFKGNLVDGVLTDIEWGDGVNNEALTSALTSDSTSDLGKAFNKYFVDNETKSKTAAGDVADFLASIKENDDLVEAFAALALTHKNTGTSLTQNGKEVSGTVTGDGYYLIADEDTHTNQTAKSKYILEVVDDVDINAKTDVPSVDKVIDDGSANGVKNNNANVNDKISYKITSKVPDFSDFNNYWMQFKDTLDKGLTLDKDSIKITLKNGDTESVIYGTDAVTTLSNNVAITYDEAYDSESLPTKDTGITITLKNFETWAEDYIGYDIIIEYDATLNKNALLSSNVNKTNSNDNSVKLEFPNDPNYKYGGEPGKDDEGEPDSSQPKGETPESRVKTYTTGIKIKKVDDTAQHNALAGAVFTIKGAINKDVLVEYYDYESDNSTGTYYKLKDGTYTTTMPNENNKDSYAEYEGNNGADTPKYKKVLKTKIEKVVEASTWTATVDDQGYLWFKDLGAGVYTIYEVTAPNGYNKITDGITITISATYGDDGVTWTVENGETPLSAEADNCYVLQIENHKGAELPETGGIGTTIFYILGSIFMVGAFTGIVLKRRKSA